MIYGYLDANVGNATEEGIAHTMLNSQRVCTCIRVMIIRLVQNRPLDKAVVLVSEPLPAVIRQIELNRIPV